MRNQRYLLDYVAANVAMETRGRDLFLSRFHEGQKEEERVEASVSSKTHIGMISGLFLPMYTRLHVCKTNHTGVLFLCSHLKHKRYR